MHPHPIKELLKQFKSGEISDEQLINQLKKTSVGEDFIVDTDRLRRTGCVEVIFASGKTTTQVQQISRKIFETHGCLFVTRLNDQQTEFLKSEYPQGEYNAISKTFRLGRSATFNNKVAIISAGTSDMQIAEEARETAYFVGAETVTIYDCGVAGIHRLFNRLDSIRGVKAIVVVAGMEGALPSVVGGLVNVPILAVPTSIGYGASFHGLAALLGMLNSCANGISVVNIDNGFGAGYNAALIARGSVF